MNVNRLRGIMAEQRITQRMLARGIGKAENTLANKMTGKTPFNADEIIAICDYLHIEDPAEKSLIFLSEPSQ